MFSLWPGPFTILLPPSSKVPIWLKGQFDTVAVRISSHIGIIQLCNAFGKALVSTSANITNMTPSVTREEVFKYFGRDFPLLHGEIGVERKPSTIINITNGKVIRYV